MIDVMNPATPVEVGALDTPGNADDVIVVGHYAYVADEWAVRVIDVVNPAAPVEVGSITTPEGAIGFGRGGELRLCRESPQRTTLDLHFESDEAG